MTTTDLAREEWPSELYVEAWKAFRTLSNENEVTAEHLVRLPSWPKRNDLVICDLGCGPGQVARYLHERGADVRGVDLSPGMIERARALTPDVPFEVGDMRALDVPDGAWQGIVAFYAIVHFQSAELPDVFREMKRVLAPGGALLLSFHIGSDVVHRDEWWGHAVDIDFRFFQTAEVTAALEEGGLIIERVLERDPYPEIEYQSRRAYIVAVKPVE